MGNSAAAWEVRQGCRALGWALDTTGLLVVPPLSAWRASAKITPTFLNTGSVVNRNEAVGEGGSPAAMSRWERGQGGCVTLP